MKETTEKKVVLFRRYTIEVTDYIDGTSHMNRENDGFNALELLGLFSYVSSEIHEQTKGKINPTIVERRLIK